MAKHVENKGTEMVDCVHNTRNLPENEGKMGGGKMHGIKRNVLQARK